MFRLITEGWVSELEAARRGRGKRLRIACPFIKRDTAQRLLRSGAPREMRVITRFDLECFDRGVSDVAALALFLASGGRVRGVRNLHSKLYLFDDDLVIATSANLTEAALTRNLEFGFAADDPAIVPVCSRYFEDVWEAAEPDLTADQLAGWNRELEVKRTERAPTRRSWPDYGVVVGIQNPLIVPDRPLPANQAFVKFFGEGDNRSPWDMPVIEVVGSSGCSWACTYPDNKPPRQVRDGDTIFMGRLVEQPNDVLIFGRAIGRQHRDSEDRASDEEIDYRPWKANWPRYVRVHDGEFIEGRLADGISLNAMMAELGANTFAATQANVEKPGKNLDPKRAMMRKAHMLLSGDAYEWLTSRLDEALARHGRLDSNDPNIDIVPASERERRSR